MSGDAIDVLKFPVPKVHELDGGRFIGTACIAVTRDPEEGWLNLGTYRAMVHDEKSVGLFMSSAGKHGRMHMEKYFKQGKPCPVVLCVGQDPLLLLAAGNPIELGYSEYDYCGGIRGTALRSRRRSKSPACLFRRTPKSRSKVFSIPATPNPTAPSANGSAITAREWKTRRCCASSAFIIATIRFSASRARDVRPPIILFPKE